MTLPIRVITMQATADFEIFPCRKNLYPRATQMTSVHTMVVELATEVMLRDSNQVTKWKARKTPLAAQSARSFPEMEASSARCSRFPNVMGSIRRTVQPRR